MTISTTTIKNSYSGSGSTSAFTYNFKITANDDIQVIIRSAAGVETVKTLGTHYNVSGVGNNSGTVTFTSGNIPTATETVVLRRSTTQTQAMDLIDNDPMSAETIETAHDKAIAINQELQEQVDRSLKLSRTNTMTSTEFTVDATNRANKVLTFDATGEIAVTQELGTFKGSDATTTTAAYVVRDIVKSTTTAQLNNIYICIQASPAGTLLTNTAYWTLIVDAVAASTSATAAAASASAAATSETNAASSSTGAAGQAANALASRVAAQSSETNAASSATAAASSATAAAGSASAAEATFDLFDDSFLGAKSSNPTVDNDGNALKDGALYFDTTNDVMKVYDLGNTVWLQLTPTVSNQNNINAVNSNSSNINAAVANASNINAAVSNASNINSAVSNASNINTVAGISSDVTAVAGISSDVQAVENIASNVTSVANINSNVSTVAGISGDVTAVANISSDVQAVENIKANVTTVAGISSNVTAVANDATDIGTVATDLSGSNNIGTVAGSISNVNNVGGSISNVNTVSSSIANVNTVASDLNEATSEIDTVATNITNVNNVGNNISNVNTVAGNNSNISTVAGINSNISTVAGISGNVTTVAGDSSDIQTVAGVTSNLGTVASNIANVNLVGGSITNVNNVGSNITGVNSFADRYRVGSSDPGSSNDAGDLFFNTTGSVLKYFDGSAFQTITAGGITDIVQDSSPQLGADLASNGNDILFADNDKAIFGAGSDLQIYHDPSEGSIVRDAGSGNLILAGNDVQITNGARNETHIDCNNNGAVELYHDNSKKFETTSTGATVTGNLAVTGTVDGRDVATDGTKLDGIEASATADQSNSEIKTAYEANSDTNAFTDAEKTKLSGIAANANNYVLPTNLAGDDINIDTGALTGATVISDLDFNVTTNTSGLVTDANASIATRNLTLANLGYTGATDATNNTGTVTSVQVTPGTGLDGGGTITSSGNLNITLDLSEFTDMTADVVGSNDELILLDSGAERRKAINEIKLSQFNNDSGFTSNTGDITNVSAGTGLSGGGSSGSVTLNIDSTVATLSGSQTLTNKSINASQLTGTLPALDGSNLTNLPGISGWSSSSGNLLPSSASAGIYLGVSSATSSNLLKDYEEGTWSPTLNNSTSGFGTGTGKYRKIGTMVTVNFGGRQGSATDMSDNTQKTMRGLPFALSSASETHASCGSYTFRGSGSKEFQMVTRQESNSDVKVTNRGGERCQSNNPCFFSMTYFTN